MKTFAVVLTVIAFIFSIFLGIYIYRGVQEQLKVQAKCPPTVTGIKSIPFEITFKAIVKNIPNGAKHLDLWMPYPQNRKAQTITNVSVKSPYPVKVNHEPEYGNAIMHLGVDNPKGDFEVEMKISAVREESLSMRFLEEHSRGFNNAGDLDLYLKEDRVGKITPELESIAKKVTAGKTMPLDKAKAVYSYIMDTYAYDFEKKKMPKERGDVAHVCTVLAGRCTELNSLFAALLRVEKIPVRFVNGFVFRNVEEGKIDGYCCRSEFFAPGYGWVPVDLASGKKFTDDSKFYFGNLDEKRLDLVAGRDIQLVPPQKGERINVFIYPYAEVDGKAFEVGKEISWKKEL